MFFDAFKDDMEEQRIRNQSSEADSLKVVVVENFDEVFDGYFASIERIQESEDRVDIRCGDPELFILK